jgi:hypothetical protein
MILRKLQLLLLLPIVALGISRCYSIKYLCWIVGATELQTGVLQQDLHIAVLNNGNIVVLWDDGSSPLFGIFSSSSLERVVLPVRIASP